MVTSTLDVGVRVVPTIVDSKGREHGVCKWGIMTPGSVRRNRGWLSEDTFTEVPDEHDIGLCLGWLRQHATIRRAENRKVGSYALKHYVEREVGEHIENGAFIVAAYRFGATIYTDDSPNPSFNMSYD